MSLKGAGHLCPPPHCQIIVVVLLTYLVERHRPRLWLATSWASARVRLNRPAQYGHHFPALTLLSVASHVWSLAQRQLIFVQTLMYSEERHSPFRARASSWACLSVSFLASRCSFRACFNFGLSEQASFEKAKRSFIETKLSHEIELGIS